MITFSAKEIHKDINFNTLQSRYKRKENILRVTQ